MLKKRLALNFGANLCIQFVTIFVQLASVPLFLSFWSKERYGAWIIISSIPAYLSLAEAGFPSASANEVSMAVAEGDRERALRSLHTACGFLAGISVVLLALTILAFYAVPWSKWLTFSAVTVDEVKWTVFFLNLYTIVGILINIFSIVYRAAYRFARNNILNNGALRLVEFAVIGLALVLSHSMIWVAGGMLVTRSIWLAVCFFDCRVLSPDLRVGVSGFSVAELKRSWRPSVMFMANSLGSAIYIQGLTLLVGVSVGAAAVVVFNTTRTLTRVIVQFVTMIRQSAWPEFSYLIGAGDANRARKLNELTFEMSVVASTTLAVTIFFAAPWIIPRWTHHAVRLDVPLLVIFLSSAVLNGFWSVTLGFLMGTNQHEALTVRYLLSATIAVFLAALSAHRSGIYGVAFAMILCELMILPYAISRTCHLLHQPVKEFIVASMQFRMVRQMLAGYYQRWLASAE
jgi:O-antigen/teichoic acid export membrane protein